MAVLACRKAVRPPFSRISSADRDRWRKWGRSEPFPGGWGPVDAGNNDGRADAILARAARRLIPVMALMYVASFLDRVNIGLAALPMNQDLGFSSSVFGLGAG